jgi:hypothetical protein
LGQFEFGAEHALAAGHFAIVDFVIVASEMEQAMEDKHLDFRGERMALFRSLTQGSGHADGEVASDSTRAGAFGGKREHVGGFVFAAELAIELANGCVRCKQDGDLAA